MQKAFEIRNLDSLDTRDAKMPAELVKAFYDLQIKSIMDIACGSGWICDYMPPGTRYFGFDPNPIAIENAKKLHPEGEFLCGTIRNVIDSPMKYQLGHPLKYDAAFLKCVFCAVKPDPTDDIVELIKKWISKYVLLYDTEIKLRQWEFPFVNAGFKLIFTHLKTAGSSMLPSSTQIWSVEK